jgi:hypothetical protein
MAAPHWPARWQVTVDSEPATKPAQGSREPAEVIASLARTDPAAYGILTEVVTAAYHPLHAGQANGPRRSGPDFLLDLCHSQFFGWL